MKPPLQKLRKNAGYKSAHAYADHLGISRASYTDYEQGRTSMPIDKAWLIADDLGISIDELVGRTPPPNADPKKKEQAREVLHALIDLLDESED